jgi:hypothetical protein
MTYLNKNICLRCCLRTRHKYDCGGIKQYTEVFRYDWKEFGILWCEKQQAWMKNRENAQSTLLTFDDAQNEKLIRQCPYVLEHTLEGATT